MDSENFPIQQYIEPGEEVLYVTKPDKRSEKWTNVFYPLICLFILLFLIFLYFFYGIQFFENSLRAVTAGGLLLICILLLIAAIFVRNLFIIITKRRILIISTIARTSIFYSRIKNITPNERPNGSGSITVEYETNGKVYPRYIQNLPSVSEAMKYIHEQITQQTS